MQHNIFYFFKRSAAFIYDVIVVVGILLISSLPWVFAGVTPEHPYYPALQVFYIVIISFYFVWFWTHGGQTLGMRAWKLRLVSGDNQRWGMPFAHAWWRLLLALPSVLIPGLAFIIACVMSSERTWYDKQSHSRIIVTDA